MLIKWVNCVMQKTLLSCQCRAILVRTCVYTIHTKQLCDASNFAARSRTVAMASNQASSTSETSANVAGESSKSENNSSVIKKSGLTEYLTAIPTRVGKSQETPRHLRYMEKVDKLAVPSTVYLQVTGNGAGGTPQGFMLQTDFIRYQFNCGEGTQRIMTEHKMKISRVSDVFITHKSWNNIGGVLGLMLSLESIKIPSLRIHGPPNVEKLVTMPRGFAKMKEFKVEKRELTEGPFQDSVGRMHYVPIFPSKSSVEEPTTKKMKTSLDEEMSVVYIFQPHEKPGALNLEKCVDLGVPEGPLFRVLKDGNEITLENGKVVKPEDVVDPSEPSPPFLVIECPDEQYLDNLLSNIEILEYQQQLSKEIPSLVVHFTKPEIMECSQYQEWMSRFGGNTQHLLLNGTGPDISMEGVYRIQAKLNLLHPGIFPLLPQQLKQAETDPKDDAMKKSIQSGVSTVTGEALLSYCIRGSKNERIGQFDRSKCIALNNQAFIEEAYKEGDGFREALKVTHEKLKEAPEKQNSQYPEIIFLGTGSSVPSKVRNASGILLHLSKEKCMFMDCGEDTYGQLLRHYAEKTAEVLMKTVAVFVSHLHADHHLGLLRLATAREKAFLSNGLTSDPLKVYAPKPMLVWLESVDAFVQRVPEDLLTVIPLENLHEDTRQNYVKEYDEALQTMNLSQFLPVVVRHRQYPHGIVMTHRDGWKLTYSGDTMPCTALAKAGQGSTILIHEATMEDEMEEEAKIKKHCTTSQALNIGTQMRAEFILLTHFSQRYAKIPFFSDQFSSKVGIAFDNMRVQAGELHLLPVFRPALKALFAEQYAEMEQKREKRMYAKARKQKRQDSTQNFKQTKMKLDKQDVNKLIQGLKS